MIRREMKYSELVKFPHLPCVVAMLTYIAIGTRRQYMLCQRFY